VLPLNATNTGLTWTSNNTAVATVAPVGTTATVAPVGEGTTTITVASVANPALVARCDVTVRYVPLTNIFMDKQTVDVSSFYLPGTVVTA